MRMALYASVLAAFGLLAAAAPAQAQEEFDVSVAGGKITVVTKGDWHVNKAYPWKVKQGDKVVADTSKFDLSEKSASVSPAAKGALTVKGAVCSAANCKPFEVTVNN